jgi:uncharacterized protein (TIGR02594 family)
MAKLPDKLTSLLKEKVLSKNKDESSTSNKDSRSINLKIIVENTMSFQSMARDMNVARQNVQQLVKLMGGKAKTGADSQFKSEEQRRKLAGERTGKEKSPTKVEKESVKKSSFVKKLKLKAGEKFKQTKAGKKVAEITDKFKKSKVGKKIINVKNIVKTFSAQNILKSFQKYFTIFGIFAIIWDSFKDTFTEWVGGLWETIKESFDKFVTSIKEWFKEVVQPIIDDVKDLVTKMIERVSEFFGDFGKWVVEKFEKIKEFFEPALSFIKNTFDKFLNVIDDIKSKLKSVVEKVLLIPGVQKLIPDSVLNFIKRALGIIPPEEAKRPAAADTRTEKQVEEEAKSARERQKQAAEKVATTTGKEKEKAEQEERDAANTARQRELEAKNRRQQERRQKSEAEATQAKEQPTAPAAAPAPTKQEQPTTAPTTAPTPTTTGAPAKTEKAPGAPSAAPGGGGATGSEAAPTITPTPAKKGGKDASAGLSGRAADFANELPKYGITNKFAIQALVATSAKESGLNPQAKESGAQAYLNTLKSRGIEYIWKVFPQLKPGGWAAKRLGEKETGAQPATLEKIWSQGDEAFFDSVYGGLSTNEKAGDGFLYRGRGLIGITGRTVYRGVGKEVGMDLESNPDIVAQDFKSAVGAAAGYIFFTRKGKEKALKEMNSFTDFDTALKYTLRTVAGLGHNEADFEKKGAHLHEQLRKASEFKQLAEDSSSGKTQTAEAGTPVQTGAGVPLSTGYGGVVTTTPAPAPAPTPKPSPKPAAAPEAVPKKEMGNQLETDALKSKDIVNAASKMIGLNENEHTQQLLDWMGKYSGTPYLQIDSDAGPWCAKFVNAVLGTLGIKGTGMNTAFSFKNWGGVVFDKETGKGDVTAALPGDIIVTSRGGGKGHVAITESASGSRVNVIGGNQSGKGHTGGVTKASTSLAAVIAIRRPGMKFTGEAVVPTNAEANKQADLGKMSAADNLHASGTPKGPTGTEVAKASGEVASAQRQQQKPSTPNVINAPTTNNTIVAQNTPPSSTSRPRDTGTALASRAS